MIREKVKDQEGVLQDIDGVMDTGSYSQPYVPKFYWSTREPEHRISSTPKIYSHMNFGELWDILFM